MTDETKTPIDLPPRFFGKVKRKGECLIWIAAKDKDGYGRVRDGNQVTSAHRYAWKWANPGRSIGALCIARNPDSCPTPHTETETCVRPEHLGAYTKREITLRSALSVSGQHRRQMRCKRGHPFTVENTYIYRGERRCRICQNLRQKAKKESTLFQFQFQDKEGI